MESYYRSTKIPSLIARCETLARELRRGAERNTSDPGADDAHAAALTEQLIDVMSFERELATLPPSNERAKKALTLLLHGSTGQGAIWLMPHSRARMLAESDDTQLLAQVSEWVQRRASEESALDATDTADLDSASQGDPNLFETAGMFCRLFWLREPAANASEPVGALVLAHPNADRGAPSHELLDALARHLSRIAEAVA
jgi:hypothetical protein